MGTTGFFAGVKRPGSEADHNTPSSAQVKIGGVTPPIPQYVFMAWYFFKHFIFSLDLYCFKNYEYLSFLLCVSFPQTIIIVFKHDPYNATHH
jgi:hypothetical protein